MNKTRMIRVNEEIKREVSEIIRSEIKDPRAGVMTTVVKVDTTNDLKHSKIYVSVLGGEKEKSDTMEGLLNATGFIKKRLAERLNLRNTPNLKFILDESAEYSIKIHGLLNELNARGSSEGDKL